MWAEFPRESLADESFEVVRGTRCQRGCGGGPWPARGLLSQIFSRTWALKPRPTSRSFGSDVGRDADVRGSAFGLASEPEERSINRMRALSTRANLCLSKLRTGRARLPIVAVRGLPPDTQLKARILRERLLLAPKLGAEPSLVLFEPRPPCFGTDFCRDTDFGTRSTRGPRNGAGTQRCQL